MLMAGVAMAPYDEPCDSALPLPYEPMADDMTGVG